MGDGSGFEIKPEKIKNILDIGRTTDLILDEIEEVRRNTAVYCYLIARAGLEGKAAAQIQKLRQLERGLFHRRSQQLAVEIQNHRIASGIHL